MSNGDGNEPVDLIELLLMEGTPPRQMMPDKACEADETEALAPPSSPCVILLVEDHEITRMVLAQLLTRRKHTVFTADCIATAREIASREKLDLLISDIGLPDGNGNDLMKEFKETYGLRGIALTGYGMEGDVARGRAAGFVTHLTKPVSIRSLEQAVTMAWSGV